MPHLEEDSTKRRGKPLTPSLSSRELVYMDPLVAAGAQQITGLNQSPSEALLLEKQAKRRHWLLACAMMLLLVALISLSSQLSNIAFTDPSLKFHAPFLFLLIKMSFRILTFPVYLVISSLTRKCRGKPADIKENVRHCSRVYGTGNSFTWRKFSQQFFPSALTVLATQIGWILGLAHLSASVATAIICSAVAFSYMFTSCCMAQPCLLVKSLFVAVAFAGVCLIVYGNFAGVITTSNIIGIVAVLGASVFDALHLLAFKKAFPELDIGQTSFVVSCMYLLNCLVLWPVPIILTFYQMEKFSTASLPYGLLFGAWIASSVSSIAAGYGLVLSNPFFMSISELLILATNTVIDVLFRHVQMHHTQIAGSVMVAVSFLILVIPDEYVSVGFKSRTSKHKTESAESPSRKESVPVDRKVIKEAETHSAMNVHGLDRMAAAE